VAGGPPLSPPGFEDAALQQGPRREADRTHEGVDATGAPAAAAALARAFSADPAAAAAEKGGGGFDAAALSAAEAREAAGSPAPEVVAGVLVAAPLDDDPARDAALTAAFS
jgi:hypothetical protein